MTLSTKADRRIAVLLAVVITIAWAVSLTVDILNNEYDPPASVHMLMMVVSGAVFGGDLVGTIKTQGAKNGKEN